MQVQTRGGICNNIVVELEALSCHGICLHVGAFPVLLGLQNTIICGNRLFWLFLSAELPSPSLAPIAEMRDSCMKLFRATRPTELGYTYEELKSMDEISVTLIPEKKGVVFKHVEYLVESKVKYGREEMELCKANDIANLSSSLSPSFLCPSLFVPLSNRTWNHLFDGGIVTLRLSMKCWWPNIPTASCPGCLLRNWQVLFPPSLTPSLPHSLPLSPPPSLISLSPSSPASSAFIEQRRRAMKRFLLLISRHPVLARDEVVKFFLSASGHVSHQ